MPSVTALTCRSRAWNSPRWRSRSTWPMRRALSPCSTSPAIAKRTHRPGNSAVPRARLRRPVPDSDLRRRRGARPPGRRDLQPRLQPPHRKAVNVRSEARDAYRVYRSTYDIASHYQREILPLRKIITEEMQLRFSSMQIDVFALLTEARQRLASLRAAIDAKRAFWLAQSDLQTAVNGGGTGAREIQQPRQLGAGGWRRALKGDQQCFHAEDFSAPPRWSAPAPSPVASRPRAIPEAATMDKAVDAAAAASVERTGLSTGGDPERLDAAMAHERRLEGISSGRRTGRARIRRRHEGATCGATTARRRDRRSRRSRATRCASSSPTGCPSPPPCTGTA